MIDSNHYFKIRGLVLLSCLLFLQESVAQLGGRSVYEFLATPVSARATAQGGIYNHVYDGDAALAIANPAMLQPSMHKHMALSYSPYFAGTHAANFNYIHDLDLATFQFGTVFMSYGQQEEFDENGNRLGLFNANDMAIYAGAGHTFHEKYSFGANAKLIYSQIDNYHSLGMAFDLSAMYIDTAKLFSASFVVRNLGFQMKAYTSRNQEFLPTDIQFGFSKRFKHLPFRINVTAWNFQRWDVRYDDPNAQQQANSLFDGEEAEGEKKAAVFFDNLARHFIFGGEFDFGKKQAFRLGFAYNHQRRAELALDSKGGLSGFSFGFGLHIKRFDIQYGMGKYALAGSANQLTLNINLGEQMKTKK